MFEISSFPPLFFLEFRARGPLLGFLYWRVRLERVTPPPFPFFFSPPPLLSPHSPLSPFGAQGHKGDERIDSFFPPLSSFPIDRLFLFRGGKELTLPFFFFTVLLCIAPFFFFLFRVTVDRLRVSLFLFFFPFKIGKGMRSFLSRRAHPSPLPSPR